MKFRKIVLAALASAAIVASTWGGVTANAATHSAVKCNNYCSGGSAVQCSGAYLYKTTKAPGDNPASLYSCSSCGETARYWVYLKCNKCSYYSNQDAEDTLTSDMVCSKSSCWSWIQSVWKENGGAIDGGHDKTASNGDVTYNECSHGNIGPHYLACTKHPDYSGRAHWYCTTHNYVGTSPTCTYVDLAVRPSPTSMSLTVGQSQTITPNATAGASVSYTANNANVATVSATGIVTGKGKGNATIVVKATK